MIAPDNRKEYQSLSTLFNDIRCGLVREKPVSASPAVELETIAFKVFSSGLFDRKPAGGVWIISFSKIILDIMHKTAARRLGARWGNW
jgi:hypothetical protein